MAVSTVNISFQEELLREIDSVAKEEARSRSELIREAARLYIEKKKRWQSIFAYGKAAGEKLDFTDENIVAEIRASRKSGG
jgi:CopG family transcriptional regulator / antitoxin EndoAI